MGDEKVVRGVMMILLIKMGTRWKMGLDARIVHFVLDM